MLIFLPPSEGKAAARRGARLDLAALSLPELAPARDQVLAALTTLCASDPDKAAAVLGLSPGQRGDIDRNAALRTLPTLPASRLYTGVVYDSLGYDNLEPAAKRLAQRSVLIFSGLWGVLRLGDRVPSYRCPVGANLPGIGGLGPYWRGPLAAPLAEVAGRGVVLDLRSTGYAAMWRPEGDLARRTVTVRILHERVVDGVATRSVVSHFNKATKGRLVRDLLTAGVRPKNPTALTAALRDLGYTVEERPGPTPQLDLVVAEL